MRTMSKKSIAIFGYKQRLLSIDMKTKVVQHVERVARGGGAGSAARPRPVDQQDQYWPTEMFVLAIVINLKHEQMKKKLLLMRSSKIVNGNIVSLKVAEDQSRSTNTFYLVIVAITLKVSKFPSSSAVTRADNYCS